MVLFWLWFALLLLCSLTLNKLMVGLYCPLSEQACCNNQNTKRGAEVGRPRLCFCEWPICVHACMTAVCACVYVCHYVLLNCGVDSTASCTFVIASELRGSADQWERGIDWAKKEQQSREKRVARLAVWLPACLPVSCWNGALEQTVQKVLKFDGAQRSSGDFKAEA